MKTFFIKIILIILAFTNFASGGEIVKVFEFTDEELKTLKNQVWMK